MKSGHRYLESEIRATLKKKMVFISGPRQVGKTTLSKSLLSPKDTYLNYDFSEDRRLLLKQQLPQREGLIILDEVHKMRGWRNLIKGYYDKFHPQLRIIVTGSARLDYYRKGGDSLQGRYRHFRLHPFSIQELGLSEDDQITRLLTLGGFPEPYLSNSEREAQIWRNDYFTRLVREDIAQLENVQDLSLLEQLMIRLPDLVGSPLSINSLREDLGVAHASVVRWLEIFERSYLIYRLRPFGAPLIKAVKKESKHYHYDWAVVEDEGARFENMVAGHLLKWIHFQHDVEGKNLELRFFRDLDGREVDFVVQDRRAPLFFVECKLRSRDVSPHLLYLKRQFPVTRAVQVSSRKQSKVVTKEGIEMLSAADFLKEFV